MSWKTVALFANVSRRSLNVSVVLFGQLLKTAKLKTIDLGSLSKSPNLEAFARVQHFLLQTEEQES